MSWRFGSISKRMGEKRDPESAASRVIQVVFNRKRTLEIHWSKGALSLNNMIERIYCAMSPAFSSLRRTEKDFVFMLFLHVFTKTGAVDS